MTYPKFADAKAIGKVNPDLTKSAHAISEFDGIKLPGNVDSRLLTNGALYNALEAAGVPNIHVDSPRSANLDALAAHVEKLKQDAATKAVDAWLASKARPAIANYYATLDPKVAQQQVTATDPHLDALPLPSGQPIKDLTNGELTNLLIEVGVPGVSAEQGRREVLAAYWDFLESLKAPAMAAAVAKFAAGK
jgi:hypothetical protein